jgi:hypothetical protein
MTLRLQLKHVGECGRGNGKDTTENEKSQVCVWRTASPVPTEGIPRGVGKEKRRKFTSLVHKLANELRVQHVRLSIMKRDKETTPKDRGHRTDTPLAYDRGFP